MYCTVHTKECQSFTQGCLHHLCLLKTHQPYLNKCHTGFDHDAYRQCVTCPNPLGISQHCGPECKAEVEIIHGVNGLNSARDREVDSDTGKLGRQGDLWEKM